MLSNLMGISRDFLPRRPRRGNLHIHRWVWMIIRALNWAIDTSTDVDPIASGLRANLSMVAMPRVWLATLHAQMLAFALIPEPATKRTVEERAPARTIVLECSDRCPFFCRDS